jgi:dihydrofolate reductase
MIPSTPPAGVSRLKESDELTLMIHPVVVGRGKRLFKDWSDLKRLKLIDSKITRTGVALVTYGSLK